MFAPELNPTHLTFACRLVQFYIRIGSKSLGPTCTRPRSRNEGVCMKQYSSLNLSSISATAQKDFFLMQLALKSSSFFSSNPRCTGPILHQQRRAVAVPEGAGLQLLPGAAGGHHRAAVCCQDVLHCVPLVATAARFVPLVFFFMCVHFALNLLPSVCRSAGKHSAQWALDDILIGMNDSSRTGFHDKFDGMTPLRHNWYRIQGGEVTVDCLSLDTALTFNSEAIDSESRTY